VQVVCDTVAADRKRALCILFSTLLTVAACGGRVAGEVPDDCPNVLWDCPVHYCMCENTIRRMLPLGRQINDTRNEPCFQGGNGCKQTCERLGSYVVDIACVEDRGAWNGPHSYAPNSAKAGERCSVKHDGKGTPRTCISSAPSSDGPWHYPCPASERCE
jgi:hypothetical protein